VTVPELVNCSEPGREHGFLMPPSGAAPLEELPVDEPLLVPVLDVVEPLLVLELPVAAVPEVDELPVLLVDEEGHPIASAAVDAAHRARKF